MIELSKVEHLLSEGHSFFSLNSKANLQTLNPMDTLVNKVTAAISQYYELFKLFEWLD